MDRWHLLEFRTKAGTIQFGSVNRERVIHLKAVRKIREKKNLKNDINDNLCYHVN